MKCIKCGGIKSKVLNTYHVASKKVTRRYRQCSNCGWRFNTLEVADDNMKKIIDSANLSERIVNHEKK